MPSYEQLFGEGYAYDGGYVWRELDRDKYRSSCHAMRFHDLVRDDCAFRRWKR